MKQLIIYPDGSGHKTDNHTPKGRYVAVPYVKGLLQGVSVRIGDDRYEIHSDEIRLFSKMRELELLGEIRKLHGEIEGLKRRMSGLTRTVAKFGQQSKAVERHSQIIRKFKPSVDMSSIQEENTPGENN